MSDCIVNVLHDNLKDEYGESFIFKINKINLTKQIKFYCPLNKFG